MKLDILALAAHPDDVEISCMGTLLKAIHEGRKCGIIDFTRGEMGTRGSAELRDKEAEKAARVAGLSVRENLKMSDGLFIQSKENVEKIIVAIRQYRPDIVLINAPNDRHPDHGNAAKLSLEACFYSNLIKWKTKDESGNDQDAWLPKLVLHYIQDRWINPDITVDITDFHDQKLDVLKCFSSQFYDPNSQERETRISKKEFIEIVKARALETAKPFNMIYAEGFLKTKPLAVDNIFHLL